MPSPLPLHGTEQEANRFAVAMLMPATLVRAWAERYDAPGEPARGREPRDMCNDEYVLACARHFQAPIAVVVLRLNELGLLGKVPGQR